MGGGLDKCIFYFKFDMQESKFLLLEGERGFKNSQILLSVIFDCSLNLSEFKKS